jgi:DNA-binding NarL/FixJ family response regulator
MFSTARNDDEVATCQELGAVAYMQKPMSFEDFAKAVSSILDLAA